MRRERAEPALSRRDSTAAAHNRYLLTTLRALQTPMILLGPATASEPARAESASAEHQRLVDAIARRDAEGAREAMRVHLAGGQRARINAMLSRERD